jgi:hypothetical protein
MMICGDKRTLARRGRHRHDAVPAGHDLGNPEGSRTPPLLLRKLACYLEQHCGKLVPCHPQEHVDCIHEKMPPRFEAAVVHNAQDDLQECVLAGSGHMLVAIVTKMVSYDACCILDGKHPVGNPHEHLL